ncbi:hypothetical protein FGO68_gene16018 [Halteria grandinella]|uniref:Protein kinase domain-containing protein n=1 Tax=Halteria grandinella TaxID=5974 RepID=A0A8J8NSI8_HALGN|nr:hypothetical protein FGO68_gene16018 [Halteria grandinella]
MTSMKRFHEDKENQLHPNMIFIAPEILSIMHTYRKFPKLTQQQDLYSLGMMLFIVMTGGLVPTDNSKLLMQYEHTLFARLVTGMMKVQEREVVEQICQCLQIDAGRRAIPDMQGFKGNDVLEKQLQEVYEQAIK